MHSTGSARADRMPDRTGGKAGMIPEPCSMASAYIMVTT